jgi:hypothetical protein
MVPLRFVSGMGKARKRKKRVYRRVTVRLTQRERAQLLALMRSGVIGVRVAKRVQALQLLDAGHAVAMIHDAIGLACSCIRTLARRYEDEGLEATIYEKPRPGALRALNDREATSIIAMICSSPPESHARWTVRLIAEEAVRRKLTRTVGRETIRVLMSNHDLKPWREKNVVRPETR